MSALDLARLRAQTATSTPNSDGLAAAAALIGRRVRRAGRQVVLGHHDEAPVARDLGIAPAQLNKMALIALGICIALAWDDTEGPLYPGRSITFDEVMATGRSLGIEAGASHHVIGAIRHILTHAGFVVIDDPNIRLGPAIAGWADSDLETFRRNLDALPRPIEPSP